MDLLHQRTDIWRQISASLIGQALQPARQQVQFLSRCVSQFPSMDVLHQQAASLGTD
jgi:hypothetical protein